MKVFCLGTKPTTGCGKYCENFERQKAQLMQRLQIKMNNVWKKWYWPVKFVILFLVLGLSVKPQNQSLLKAPYPNEKCVVKMSRADYLSVMMDYGNSGEKTWKECKHRTKSRMPGFSFVIVFLIPATLALPTANKSTKIVPFQAFPILEKLQYVLRQTFTMNSLAPSPLWDKVTLFLDFIVLSTMWILEAWAWQGNVYVQRVVLLRCGFTWQQKSYHAIIMGSSVNGGPKSVFQQSDKRK